MQYPTELVAQSMPIPSHINQDALNRRGLHVYNGLDLSLATQLIERSTEPHVLKYCPNDGPDAKKVYTPKQWDKLRFKDIESILKWQAKGRLALPLVSVLGDGALKLQGFGWMGPGVPDVDGGEPAIPGARITYAERIYSDAVGQHNATPYAQAMLDEHADSFDNSGVWLEAWMENFKATSAYTNAGFEHFATIPGTLHGEPMDRVYMTLGKVAA